MLNKSNGKRISIAVSGDRESPTTCLLGYIAVILLLRFFLQVLVFISSKKKVQFFIGIYISNVVLAIFIILSGGTHILKGKGKDQSVLMGKNFVSWLLGSNCLEKVLHRSTIVSSIKSCCKNHFHKTCMRNNQSWTQALTLTH